jgi:N-hydroxyarylamine O-acetyltransferase
MSDDANIDAYFERIGFSGSIAPTLQTLEALHALHPAAIAYENLDALMGAPIRLELRNLEQKLLFEKRGGYCFEHNLLFKAMLEDLGFEVTGLGATVQWNRPDDEEDRPISHMVLLVDIAGTQYLADVGFGIVTPTTPLRLKADVEQATPNETFRLVGGEPMWQVEVLIEEEWRRVFRFDLTERSFEDYLGYNDATASDPLFRDNLMAARAEKGRRVTLFNRELSTYVVGAPPEKRALTSLGEMKDALATQFGIALPAAERLDPALERLFAETPA